MKLTKTVASALAAASLVTSPIAAQAAAPRVGSAVEGESLHGGWAIPVVAIVVAILGILVLIDNNKHDNLPSSP